MKVIAVNREQRNYSAFEFVVTLDWQEFTIITGVSSDDRNRVYPGAQHSIQKSFKHAMDVISEVDQAKKVPDMLRTLAAMMEMQLPQLELLVAEKPAESS